METVRLETQRLWLLPAQPQMAKAVLAFYIENQEFLKPFEAKRTPEFFTEDFQRKLLAMDAMDALQGYLFRFYLVAKENPDSILGSVCLGQIARGCFQSTTLGYKVDHCFTNQGYMTEAAERAIAFAFDTLNLHRVEANVMPRNLPSQRVLQKLGFQEEGLAKQYLKINGIWEDHIHFARINPHYGEQEPALL